MGSAFEHQGVYVYENQRIKRGFEYEKTQQSKELKSHFCFSLCQ